MSGELNTASLAADDGAVIPRIKLSETGYTGLKRIDGHVVEEMNRAFRFPAFLKIVDEMRVNPTVAAALNIYRMMLGRVKWSVEAPNDATDVQKERAKFIETCMTDMEGSWEDFIVETLSYLEYGYAVHEKVFRRRLRRNGSKFDDGLVGIKKLPPRSQSTIYKWLFSDDGREVLGVQQDIALLTDSDRYASLLNSGKTYIDIPRDKFLLFRADPQRDNPEGRSILKGCYLAYKQLQLVQDQEMIGIARDLGGIPCFGIPPRYMADDASPADKAVFNSFINIGENLSTGSQTSVVMPLMYDEHTKQPLFTFTLLESKGGKMFDTSKIIQRLQNDILTALGVDIIKLGGNSGDSFSLAESKTALMSLNLDYRLSEIRDVLNQDLIPALYQANGWLDTDLPKFVTSDFDNVSIEEMSKGLQRLKAVSLIEVDRPVLNMVRRTIGVKERPDDEPPDLEALNLTDGQSKSGAAFDTPTGGLNGQANSVSKQDNSANNLENSA